MKSILRSPFTSRFLSFGACLCIAAGALSITTVAQSDHVGDAPAAAPPLATDVSSRLSHRAVERAIRKVADWELRRSQTYFDQDWTFAALYAGFMSVPDAAGGR